MWEEYLGVAENCELPCGSWEINQEPLQEEQAFLTTEMSLQLLAH